MTLPTPRLPDWNDPESNEKAEVAVFKRFRRVGQTWLLCSLLGLFPFVSSPCEAAETVDEPNLFARQSTDAPTVPFGESVVASFVGSVSAERQVVFKRTVGPANTRDALRRYPIQTDQQLTESLHKALAGLPGHGLTPREVHSLRGMMSAVKKDVVKKAEAECRRKGAEVAAAARCTDRDGGACEVAANWDTLRIEADSSTGREITWVAKVSSDKIVSYCDRISLGFVRSSSNPRARPKEVTKRVQRYRRELSVTCVATSVGTAQGSVELVSTQP